MLHLLLWIRVFMVTGPVRGLRHIVTFESGNRRTYVYSTHHVAFEDEDGVEFKGGARVDERGYITTSTNSVGHIVCLFSDDGGRLHHFYAFTT